MSGTGRKNVRRIVRVDNIWALALGYFLVYIPYSFFTKTTSDGLLPGVPPTVGFVILPVSAIATLLSICLFATVNGWWKYLKWRTIGPLRIPAIRGPVVLAGLGMAVIMGTTTLAYSFSGISIVFMMVLMRGGVLMIARGTDLITGRDVRWESVAGFVLALAALAVALTGVTHLNLTVPAIINVSAHLAGYVCRFQVISRMTKNADHDGRMRYFVEEQAVAMPVLVLTCLGLLLVGGETATNIGAGFSLLAGSPILIPALIVGFFYACLYTFGTLIYLYPREHTYCVPINSASNILAGVVAAVIISLMFDRPGIGARDLIGAGLLVAALAVLAVPAYLASRRAAPLRRMFLFVCAGNTARSPIAQAICTAQMAARLNISMDMLHESGVEVISAGLTARVGNPMKPEAVAALQELGVAPHDHIATQVTPELIGRATVVCCMSEEQRRALLELAPSAAGKIRCLAPEGDLDEPMGHEATLAFARRVFEMMDGHVGEFVVG